jgi:hypothetical protein
LRSLHTHDAQFRTNRSNFIQSKKEEDSDRLIQRCFTIWQNQPEFKDPETPEGKLWLVEAKKGMSDARWKKEFEIDYGALGGQLVFPEWETGTHVVKEFKLDLEDWSVWMACDPHPRTPRTRLSGFASIVMARWSCRFPGGQRTAPRKIRA